MKYQVLFDFVAPSHYKGSVVAAEDLGDEAAPARLLKMKAIRELTEEEAAQVLIDELELSDGDGIAYDALGVNVAPDAPPQPDPDSLAARTAKKATTSAVLPGTIDPDAQAAADKAAADKAAADKAAETASNP